MSSATTNIYKKLPLDTPRKKFFDFLDNISSNQGKIFFTHREMLKTIYRLPSQTLILCDRIYIKQKDIQYTIVEHEKKTYLNTLNEFKQDLFANVNFVINGNIKSIIEPHTNMIKNYILTEKQESYPYIVFENNQVTEVKAQRYKTLCNTLLSANEDFSYHSVDGMFIILLLYCLNLSKSQIAVDEIYLQCTDKTISLVIKLYNVELYYVLDHNNDVLSNIEFAKKFFLEKFHKIFPCYPNAEDIFTSYHNILLSESVNESLSISIPEYYFKEYNAINFFETTKNFKKQHKINEKIAELSVF